jgi:hypothetical protein
LDGSGQELTKQWSRRGETNAPFLRLISPRGSLLSLEPMKMIGGIKPVAILIALFAFYIAPIIPLTLITSIPNFFGAAPSVGQRIPWWQSAGSLLVLWIWALAPVGSGYLAARLAEQQPLLHGLVAGVVGALVAVLWVQGAWAFELVIAVLVATCGLFGGWLWRRRGLKRQNGL